MSKPEKPCAKCKGEMKAVQLEAFHGEDGGVKLTIQGMPAVACDQGHRRFLYPEFAALVMDFVNDPDHYDIAEQGVKKGLFRKHYHCPGCGKELPEAASAAKRVEHEAQIKHADPFKVGAEVPVFRCGCGRESMHAREEVAHLAFKAIGHAYRSIDIHPE